LVISLVVCLLGLVGTPPTAVFVGKLAVFAATGDGAMVWLVVLAAVNTVASLFYYLRLIAAAAGVPWERSGPVRVQPPGAEGTATSTATSTATAAATATATATRLESRASLRVLHVCAAASLALGVAAAAWLAVALPG
ncbi:hypothetical protein ACWKWC_07415, partial [Geodermatophilus nigrescens]